MAHKWFFGVILLLLLTLAAIVYFLFPGLWQRPAESFSGDSAYQFVEGQMQYGPRTPGSVAHEQVQDYISNNLKKYGWQVETQKINVEGHDVFNIIGKRGNTGEITLLGAHYDSRFYATEETSQALQSLPVPGANDGASGVAVLLEIARTLPELPGRQIWLVFFDAEDQGRIENWDWILGSKGFVQNIEVKPVKSGHSGYDRRFRSEYIPRARIRPGVDRSDLAVGN